MPDLRERENLLLKERKPRCFPGLYCFVIPLSEGFHAGRADCITEVILQPFQGVTTADFFDNNLIPSCL